MKRAKSTFLALVAILLSPMAANADIIRYEFVGTGNGGSSGYLDFDDAGIVGPGDILSSIVDWYFTWDGNIVDNTNSTASGAFEVDAALNYAPGPINTSFDGVNTFVFNGSLDAGAGRWRMLGSVESNVQFGMSVTGPTLVPEPGTLTLLGIGLLGMGAARRRKKA